MHMHVHMHMHMHTYTYTYTCACIRACALHGWTIAMQVPRTLTSPLTALPYLLTPLPHLPSPTSPDLPRSPPHPFISPHLPASQVPRILTPLIAAVRGLDDIGATAGLSDYVHARFGSVDECRKLMLADFFKHAFDGSGADNYYDAGSCIDGRLTSAWNWCSRLEKKPYVRRP